MAMIVTKAGGGFVSKCPLCGQNLAEPIFATSHFIGDKSHDLYRFSDAAMHWTCYVHWPHQARFAQLYFEAGLRASERGSQPQYWPTLLKSADALVRYGLVVNEVSVLLRRSGTDIRVTRSDWPQWLHGGWRDQCHPDLERDALAELMPELVKLTLPELIVPLAGNNSLPPKAN